jgi:hypothetical protein
MSHVLNEYWVKGSDLLNNLLGVLVRFRGDSSDWGHKGNVPLCHDRNQKSACTSFCCGGIWTSNEILTLTLFRVSFGDNSTGTIATVALRTTAEMGLNEYPP